MILLMFGFPTGDLNPVYNAPMLGAHKWIEKTGDEGEQPEDPVQLKATFDLWKDKDIFRNADVNPEYDQFRKPIPAS